MPKLFLITGIPAAGKSTVSRALAARFAKAVSVDGDDIRKSLVSGAAELSSPLTEAAVDQLRLRYRAGSAVAATYLEAGFDAVFNDNMFGTLLNEVVEIVREVVDHANADVETYLVILNPAAETVLDRDAAREVWHAYEGEAWDVRDLHRGLVEETPKGFGLWLDTSAQSPEETVDEILARLPESLLAK